MILSPTRELASQIHKEATKFCYGSGIASTVVYGGVNIQSHIKELNRGIDVLVATPGRLLDLLEKKHLSLEKLEYLVLDEADRMLDMGFEAQIRDIIERSNIPDDCCTFMFSATFPNDIQHLATRFLKNFIFVSIGEVGLVPNDVELVFEQVNDYQKPKRIVELLSDIGKGLILFL